MSDVDRSEMEAVAVIGLAGRFPGAPDADRFWRNLCDGVESLSSFSDDELRATGVPGEVYRRPGYVRAKGVLEEPEKFDAEFFGLTPHEAEVMDPQQRLFLECCWHACEDAGLDLQTHGGRVGVYAGASSSSYLLSNLLTNPARSAALGTLQARILNDKDFLTTWVSYKLNLRGPSVAVQTACSTSLVAVHFACQGLLDGECAVALAGGVSVSFPHRAGYLFQEGGVLSPDGHCRAFDAAARGSVEGNGAGVVVLRRLGDALADGSPVRAVIKGSALNNDGSLKAGFTAPGVESQSRVIAEALSLAGVPPETVTYVEAHGSGTPLGDSIEVEALTRAFRAGGSRRGFCALGSVKTNIGHLDAAAGVAGLIKTVRALEERKIPPSLHFNRPNPLIDFAAGPFYVNTRLRDWPADQGPCRAGVSSFGIGGTNVHVVLEEAPAREPSGPSRPWQLLTWSARTATALEKATANLAGHLEKTGGTAAELADAAYTLKVGRQRFRHRRALVCRDWEDAAMALREADPRQVLTEAGRGASESREPGVAFLFPGLGDQRVGMGLELYQGEPTFRDEVDRCASILEPCLGADVRRLLYPEGAVAMASKASLTGSPDLRRLLAQETAAESDDDRRLSQTAFAQPALFVLEYALARLLQTWGIHPRAMIGYSLGEYVAACLAGVFTLEEALALVAERARMIQDLSGGAMLAVPLPEEEVESLLEPYAGELSLSAANGSSLAVVGGPAEMVETLARRLAGLGVEARWLRTTHAFHSRMMLPLYERFRERVARCGLKAPAIPFVSNLTGDWITPEQAKAPAYWAEHLVRTVLFGRGLGHLLAGDLALLEVGPGKSLATLARQHPSRTPGQVVLSTLPDRRDEVSEAACLLTALGHLWLAGVAVDWRGFYAHERRRRVRLPVYPFERRRYWIEPGAGAPPGPLDRKADLADWFYVHGWERSSPARLSPGQEGPGSRWLIFLDGCGLGSRLAGRLERMGRRVATVRPGDGFDAEDVGAYTVDPRRRESYESLVRDLHRSGALPDVIVHLWAVTPDDGGGQEDAAAFLDLGFYSLLFLAQALCEQGVNGPVLLGVVSNHLQEVTGEETLQPAKAALLGPCRVIPREYPNLTCKSIDVVLAGRDGQSMDAMAEELVAELTRGPADPAVAYRGRHRWRQTFAPVRLDGSPRPPSRLRRGGVYLVTGAAEETGAMIAEHLARAVDANLALVVPAGFPRREEWAGRLRTGGGEDEVSAAIRRLLRLETAARGALVLPVDAADERGLAAAVAETCRRFGALHGVVHAASAPGGGLIQLKTPAAAAAALAPKMAGTLALAAVTRGLDLDFMVLFATSAAALGGVGQADSCAAAAFLDAFARRSVVRGLFTAAIAWSAFRWDSWQEPALVGAPGLEEKLRQSLEAFGMDAAEGAEAFDRVLDSALPQVIVSPRDLGEVSRSLEALTVDSLLEEIHPSESHGRPPLSSAYVAPSTDTEEAVAAVWQDAFGIDRLGVHDDFFELSGHSLLAIQIVTRLRNRLRANLPMTILFEAPTVAGLARRIDDSRGIDLDPGDAQALLDEIRTLSPEQAEARLAAEMGRAGRILEPPLERHPG